MSGFCPLKISYDLAIIMSLVLLPINSVRRQGTRQCPQSIFTKRQSARSYKCILHFDSHSILPASKIEGIILQKSESRYQEILHHIWPGPEKPYR